MPNHHTVTQLLRWSAAGQLFEPEHCLRWVKDVNAAYLNYDRHRCDTGTLVDLKLATIFWRGKMLDTLIQRPPAWYRQHPLHYQEILLALNTYINGEQQTALASRLGQSEHFHRLMANQGIRTGGYGGDGDEAGPGVDLKFIANRNSPRSLKKWKQNPAFSRYRFSGDGVRYRGVFFRPGDVLLTNVNLDGNGVYTSLSDPKGFSSHSAFFAILEDQGRRFPVAVETFEKGVRPVPLNVFLGPRFCAYAEVYRHQELSSSRAEAINRAAVCIINDVKGYNFDSEDDDRDYMSCTSVGRFLHEDAGLRGARTSSELCAGNVQENLSRLGYTFFKFFAPVDYLLDQRFRCVGWVDNNQIDRLLARELVDRAFREQFVTRKIRPEKFPFPYRINRWGIGQIRRQTLIGKIIGLVHGFDHVSLPKGPDDLLAVITLVEKQLGRSIVNTRRAMIHELEKMDHLDMQQLGANYSASLRQWLNLRWLSAD